MNFPIKGHLDGSHDMIATLKAYCVDYRTRKAGGQSSQCRGFLLSPYGGKIRMF